MRKECLFGLWAAFAMACASGDLQEQDLGGRSGADARPSFDDASTGGGRTDGGATEDGRDGGTRADVTSPPSGDASTDAGADAADEPTCTDPSAPGWETLGALHDDTLQGDAMTPSLVIDNRCRPIVAWHQANAAGETMIHVRRFDGTDWQAMGGPLDAVAADSTSTSGVRLATRDGAVALSWAEWDGSKTAVFAARWNGNAWEVLPSPAAASTSSGTGLALDASGRLHVAWSQSDGGSGRQIHVARFDAGLWGMMGNGLKANPESNSTALSPVLTFTANDELVLAWQESSFVHLRRWSGTSFEPFAGGEVRVNQDLASAFDPQVTTDASGRLLLGWREASASTDVYVERWDGAWEVLGHELDAEPENGRTNTGWLSLAVDSQDRAVVSWDEPQDAAGGTLRIHVWRHDGNAFAPLAEGVLDAAPGDTDGYYSSVAVDPQDRVVVAWDEQTDRGRRIMIWRHTD